MDSIQHKAYPEFGGLTGEEIVIRLQVLDNLLNTELDTAYLEEALSRDRVEPIAASVEGSGEVARADFKVIAHRGWSGSYPENTLIGMREAIKLGCHMIEFDVAFTRDRKLIIIHDNTLSRTTDGAGEVREWNYKDLRALDAGSWFHPRYAGTRLPALDELLLISRDSDIQLNIEIKKECWEEEMQPDGVEQQIIAAIRRYEMMDQVLVSSFRWGFLDRLRTLAPEVRTACLHYKDVGRLSPSYLKKRFGIVAFNPHAADLTQRFVEECHEADIQVYPFTINSYQDMERCLDMGVDGMFTNHPNRLFQFLAQHASRHSELRQREAQENVADLDNAIRRLELEELDKARRRSRWRAKRMVLQHRKDNPQP